MSNHRGLRPAGLILSAALLCSSLLPFSDARAATTNFGVGARYHATHTRFPEYPFRDGDLSWLAGIELQEGIGFWQLLVGYTPSITQDEDSDLPEIDSIITPQLNLILQDRGWMAGTGIAADYIKDEVDEDWSDIYFQTMLGYQFELPFVTLDIMAVYAFDNWGNISDFKFDNLEYSIILKRTF